MYNRPQQASIPILPIAQDFLDQAEMMYQDVCRNAMQANIKNKTCYDKKADVYKLKEADYVYVLQTKTDHEGVKLPLQNFGVLAPTF